MNDADVTLTLGKPAFEQIQGWIDAGQAFMYTIPGHAIVVRGYEVSGGHRWLDVNDPWVGPVRWDYDTSNLYTVFAMPTGVRSRQQEASVTTDTDHDGIVDFDEINRFHTNPNQADSDGDGVPDKTEIRAYTFDDFGDYAPRAADFDNDGVRMELDTDSDQGSNVGSSDGCEDGNHNGVLNPGESSNFNPDDEKHCEGPVVQISSPAPNSQVDTCVVSLAGTVTSDRPLTALCAQVTAGGQSSTYDLNAGGSAPNFTFNQNIPIFSGQNVILISALNEFGSGNAGVNVECPSQIVDLHTQITWDSNNTDVDLHLIRPGGSMGTYDDCYYRNRHPDWGVPGDPLDDPMLDVDDTNGYGPENIVLQRTESGQDYFLWPASVDDFNYYGWQSSGNTGGWRQEMFDLSNVSGLGSLLGQAQVWLAYVMTNGGRYF